MKPTSDLNRYTAIIVVSQRARQLIDGAEPTLEVRAKKPVSVAIEELHAGKISWQRRTDGTK